jgi:hypothetical protein
MRCQEEAVPFTPAEADLSMQVDQSAVRRKNMDAVRTLATKSGRRPQIAVDVAADTVLSTGEARRGLRSHTSDQRCDPVVESLQAPSAVVPEGARRRKEANQFRPVR